ncbi:MAG: formylglycine-generating enzyme family protein [Spirochaetales bacterium]|nr:formylglycine-generating enzyme family protein [Spirochaetales bacterium]
MGSRDSSGSGPEDGFVLVRGGTFQMGSADISNAKPVHSVTVSSFYMSKYEVTQGEYKAVMGSNPSDSGKGIGDKYPVNKVNWNEAVEYCNKLSRKEGLTPVYSGSGNNISMNINANGYRLPTEAEWEYAARGGNSSRGYTYSGSNTIGSVAWYKDNSGSKSHPVGQKQANEIGLYDMSGNVWEWCWDWYGSYSSGRQTDPTGKSSGSSRVFRGGSWGAGASGCRSADRGYYYPSDRGYFLGFRLVRRP